MQTIVVADGLLGAGSPGAMFAVFEIAAEPPSTAPGVALPPPISCGSHVHAAGQFDAVAQATTFASQWPGKLVVHMSGGAVPPSTAGTGMLGSLAAAPPDGAVAPLDDAEPLPEPPEHSVDGLQVNPSPQSVSTSHANCHLYAHVEIDVGWQGVGSVHFVPEAQAMAGVAHPTVAG